MTRSRGGGRRGEGRGGGGGGGGKPSRGGGFGNTTIGEELRIAVNLALKNFRQREEETELEFPSSLLSTERAYVHKLATELGLASKSRGKGQTRYLTVFKKEGSTLLARDAELSLSDSCLRMCSSLLQRAPVTSKERALLMPVQERERGSAAPDISGGGGGGRSMGRLGGGVAQVPPLPSASEDLIAAKERLPIFEKRDAVMAAINSAQVVIITGDTGSGKTTQVAQYILEDAAEAGQSVRLAVTEPRRLAAVTVAERVAAERGEKVGGTVGYQIRLESCVSPKTCLTFGTYGVLLRSLMGGDAILASLTHVHERDAMSDFLVTVLRDALARHRGLRLILMSATVDTQQLLTYFPGAQHISVGGNMFPVEQFHLEDILEATGYCSRQMSKQKQMQRSRQSLEDLTQQLVLGNTGKQKQQHVEEVEEDLVVVEEEQEESVEDGDEEVVVVDPTMDHILGQCFLNGADEDFVNLEQQVSEGENVDYRHSVTGVTALMVAASRGKLQLLELLLQLGADSRVRASNGWTAADFCKKTGQVDCQELLEEVRASEGRPRTPSLPPAPSITPEQQRLVELYLSTVDEDRVDCDLVLHLLVHIHTTQGPGAVLVFLPGYEDIAGVRDLVGREQQLSDVNLLVLHSQVASQDHRRAFLPSRQRKVILATNVAETSITVPDVVFVVDSGKVKQKTYDALTLTTSLRSEWISQTSATQRMGRAGRCQPGMVFRMFSSTTHASLSQYGTPEILRTPLLALCLQTKLLAPPNTPIADFLARVPDPPPFLITRNAVQALKSLEALDPWEEVTPLGSHLLDLPLDPVYGKVLIHGVFLKCLDPILTIACTLAYRTPFMLPVEPGAKKAADAARRRLACDTGSDHMAVLKAFQEWQQARMEGRERAWCQRNMVSSSTMEMVVGMRNQVLGQLRASGFVRARGQGDIRDINTNSDNWGVVKACLVSGLYPNLGRVDREVQGGHGGPTLRTQRESKVKLHPSSVLGMDRSTKALASLGTDWIMYDEMTRVGRAAYMRGVTPVSPLAVALFAGPARLSGPSNEAEGVGNVYVEESSDSEEEEGGSSQASSLSLDPWTSFKCSQETVTQVSQLRQKWSSLWLRRLAASAKQARVYEEQDDAVVATLAAVLAQEEASLGLAQPQGIGQRPKQLAVDLSTGQPHTAEQRRPSDSSDDCSASSWETGSKPTRYFIVKPSAGSLAALEAAMSHAAGVWSFPPPTERKLTAAVAASNVVVLFSVSGGGAFQGCALFSGQTATEGSRSGVRLDWIAAQPVSFSIPLVAGLTNAFDEGRRLQTARDGQELDPASASELLQSMAVSPGQLSGVIERRGGRGGPQHYQQGSRGWPDVSRRRARR